MIELIELWQKRARPEPDADAFRIALAVHIEEFIEMLEVLSIKNNNYDFDFANFAIDRLGQICQGLKQNKMTATVLNREKFLDSLADQIVTAVGAGYCAGMKVTEAVTAVNASNYSKMVDGKFLYDDNGKVVKPPSYKKADLTGLY